MGKQPSNQVATKTEAALPAYMQNYEGPRTNTAMETSDVLVPRVKLLQALSPEVEKFDNAKAGQFWHTLASELIGSELRFVVIMSRKRYILFAPRDDARGILARADDAKHWNPANAEFEVKLKGVGKPVIWKTADTVSESGLAEYGTFNPHDPDDNRPAATLIYEYLIFMPDYPDMSPALFSLSRSSIKPGKDLNGKILMRSNKVPQFGQVYKATIMKDKSPEGEFFNWQFLSHGHADQDVFEHCSSLAEHYKATSFRADDESDLAGGDAAASVDTSKVNGKF